MLIEIPEDFEPAVLPKIKEKGEPPQIMYWVYNKNGQAKNYIEATGEEVLEFLSDLIGDDSSLMEATTAEEITLLPIRQSVLDTILSGEIAIRTELLKTYLSESISKPTEVDF